MWRARGGTPLTLPDMRRGDVVALSWADICASETGDTSKAAVVIRDTIAYFWERKDSEGFPCVVITSTLDNDGSHDQQGWTCIMECVIVEATVIKRGRKRAAKPKKAKAPLASEPLPGQLKLDYGDDQ